MYWDFSDILIEPEAPLLTGEGAPLIVEIGFGNGEFLEHLARTRPDCTVVGIEVSQWCLTKAARRAIAAGLSNVRLMPGDARYLLRYAFAPCSISEVYMNFPCPWPKRRHADRRVARPQFAGLIAGSLKHGGSFTLATDVDWYAAETHAVFAASDDFEVGETCKNPVREYITKYERKWMQMGRDTYMVRARKTASDTKRVMDMGNEHMECVETAAGASSSFRERVLSVCGETLEGKGYKVVFREAYFAPDDAALVLTIAVDEGFEQHYYLKLIPANGVVRGKVDAVGHPYRTPGVRASIRHLMQAITAKF